MTKFIKSEFDTFGEYVFYGPNRKFVARFKHRGPFTKAKFIKELIANHTVESYFAELDAVDPCGNKKPPLAILRDANPDWYYDILEKFSGRDLRKEVK